MRFLNSFNIALIAGALAAAPCPAMAQSGQPPASGAPKQLLPPAQTPSGSEEPAQGPASPQTLPQAPGRELQRLPDQAGTVGGPAIEMGTLDQVDSSAVGLLDDSNGGLGAKMWEGGSREAIAALMPRLPVATRSPAVNSLARRLLLTGAPAPQGAGRTIIQMRLERMMAGGLIEDIPALVAKVIAPDERMQQLAVDALLLAGKDGDACGDASLMRLESGAPYWLKIRAYCYAVEENYAGVSLTLDLMRQQNIDAPVFFALAQQIAEAMPAKITTYLDPEPLELALFRLSGVAMPGDGLGNADPGDLRAIALTQTKVPALRLAAAEKAAEIGRFDLGDLGALYQGPKFKTRALDDPQKALPSLSATDANALLYQVALKAKDNRAKAEAMLRALDFARSQGHYTQFARLYAPYAIEIVPTPELSALAPEIVRALLAAGRVDRAQDWYATLQSLSFTNAREAQVLRHIEIALAVASPSQVFSDRAQGALQWLTDEAERRGVGDPLKAQVSLEAALLDALGFPVPPDVRFRLLQGQLAGTGAMPAQTVMVGLQSASQRGSVGETVLYSLSAMGDQGPAAAHPAAVVEAVAGLKSVGLDADARAIALEALLTRSFAS
ncbi:MAG: hypothetical protein HXY22_03515 [Alphaproteobacteria bacterium]|nr:hypothetical protein [Alphaproteobacteria bacterium]